MKRFSAFLTALVCLFSLAACGGNEEAPETGTYELNVPVNLEESGAFSEDLETLDGDTAFVLYRLADAGLERGDLTGCSVLRSSGATCEEAAVLVLADEDKANTACHAVEDYVQSQIDANVDYRPDDIPKLESAVVSVKGNTVLLAVVNDAEAAQAILG